MIEITFYCFIWKPRDQIFIMQDNDLHAYTHTHTINKSAWYYYYIMC